MSPASSTDLVSLSDPSLARSGRVSNWAGTHTCRPARVCSPRDEAEVAEVVGAARTMGRRVRVIGGGHSWSEAALTSDILLRLDRLRGIERIDGHDVTVRAGTRIRDLNPALHAHGLALSNLGSIDAQSIAGAITTATHGSSLVHGVLSTLVVGVRVVDASGTVHHWTAESDPTALALAQVSLGCLGVITAVTLRCEPAFRLRVVARPLPVADAIAQAAELGRAAEYSKLWWLPHTDQALLVTGERTDAPTEARPVTDWLDHRLINPILFAGVLELGNRWPAAIPRLNQVVAGAYFRPDDRVEDSYRALHIPMPPVHLETEHAVPLAAASSVLGGVCALIDDRGFRVNFIVELRYVAGDALPLSPASGGDCCYIGGYIGRTPEAEDFMDAVEALAWSHGGRPHWGKRFRRSPEALRSRYPQWDEVLAARARLDPDGRFRNAFTDRVFGDTQP